MSDTFIRKCLQITATSSQQFYCISGLFPKQIVVVIFRQFLNQENASGLACDKKLAEPMQQAETEQRKGTENASYRFSYFLQG
ncbi:MAG TPA: hypothetical protein DCZ91_15930 [Lachnospiraceae bacterium]|nr:hypothetical protein [Lachnospiraceae bacterium]